jgi:16S rRNA (cytidine1402-2'-O)-methyltransferase
MISYQTHNRAQRLPRLLAALEDGDVALVADAGTPLVSDPGQELVAAAAERGHPVIPIPGASAPVASLSVAGLPALPFHFIGFLPRRSSERRAALQASAAWPGALIAFEAPHRLVAALRDALDVLGDRRVAVCCELTKLYEHVLRTTLSAAVTHYQSHPPRGEFTLVVEGAPPQPDGPRSAEQPENGGTPADPAARRARCPGGRNRPTPQATLRRAHRRTIGNPGAALIRKRQTG